jgi:hypothetical protein
MTTSNEERNAALEWVTQKVEEAKRSPQFGIVTCVDWLTPALAEVLMTLNTNNRYIIKSRVEQLKSDISADRFALNGETIIVSDEVSLSDGQHRCRAVIETDTAIPTVFVFGPPLATRTTVDQGSAKRPGDYLAMKNLTEPLTRSAAAFILIANEKGTSLHNAVRYISKQEMQDWLNDGSHNDELSAAISMVSQKQGKKFGSRALLVAMAFLLCRKDPAGAAEFVEKLLFGMGLERGNPILAARDKFLTGKRMKHTTHDEKMEVLIRAWNGWRKGKTLVSHQIRGNRRLEIAA